MEIVVGRENLALTVFVPYDCRNKCTFCTAKEQYRKDLPKKESVIEALLYVVGECEFPIKDVVFSGGEPTADMHTLKKMADIVPNKYNVFINTTMPRENADEFVQWVNKTKKVKGVNVSRHCESYEEDKQMLCDIVSDDFFNKLTKPVRINCVVGHGDIQKIIKRWEGKGVELCIREDYRDSKEDIHDPYSKTAMEIASCGLSYVGNTRCKVCDTIKFARDNIVVLYHRGKMESSILKDGKLEINDLIILQDGTISYDWTKNNDQIALFEMMYYARLRKKLDESIRGRSVYSRSLGCGAAKGGMRTCGSGISCGI